MNRRAAVTVLSAAVAASVALTGCGSSSGGGVTYYKNGPAGQVVEHELDDGHYEIDTKDAKGKKHEFNVTFSVYNDCQMYSYYPSCVKHSKAMKPKKDKKSDKVAKAPKNKTKKKAKKSTSKRSKKR